RRNPKRPVGGVHVRVWKAVMLVALSVAIFVNGTNAQGRRGQRGGGTDAITTGYPNRPQADPAVLERGKLLYSTNCAFCHGDDARGGDGGPNLLRTEIVLNDKSGELIGDVLRNGLSSMPKFDFNRDQISDLATYIHSFRVQGYDASRLRPQTIVVGDAK